MRFMFTCPLLIASAAIFHVSALHAAGSIEDARPGNVAEWVKQVNLKLDRAMPVGDNPTGLVVVTFRRGDDGYPTAMRVHDASPALRSAARETLRRAHQLPPLPHGINPNQAIRVLLLFAGDENMDVYSAKRRAMTMSADEANSRFDRKREPARVNVASSR
jgi:hypothetical protein